MATKVMCESCGLRCTAEHIREHKGLCVLCAQGGIPSFLCNDCGKMLKADSAFLRKAKPYCRPCLDKTYPCRSCRKKVPHWKVSLWEDFTCVCVSCCEDKSKTKESVDHPDHYGGADNPYEVIKLIEHFGLGFHLGNVVKYVLRAGKKPGSDRIEDLKKAQWYLSRFIFVNKPKKDI